MRLVTVCLLSVLVLCFASLSGCGSSTKIENRTTTTGQELQDLETARDKGLITEEEYQKKRKQIMDRK